MTSSDQYTGGALYSSKLQPQSHFILIREEKRNLFTIMLTDASSEKLFQKGQNARNQHFYLFQYISGLFREINLFKYLLIFASQLICLFIFQLEESDQQIPADFF